MPCPDCSKSDDKPWHTYHIPSYRHELSAMPWVVKHWQVFCRHWLMKASSGKIPLHWFNGGYLGKKGYKKNLLFWCGSGSCLVSAGVFGTLITISSNCRQKFFAKFLWNYKNKRFCFNPSQKRVQTNFQIICSMYYRPRILFQRTKIRITELTELQYTASDKRMLCPLCPCLHVSIYLTK